MIASAVLQAKNTAAAGQAEKLAADARAQGLDYQAAQIRQQAGQERAASQRGAAEQRRQGRLLSSKAQARAAASGAGGPGLEKILGDISAEGEYRALSELFVGEERARGMETQAALKVFEGTQERAGGRIARRAATREATMSLIGSAGKGLSRYGKKPKKPYTPNYGYGPGGTYPAPG